MIVWFVVAGLVFFTILLVVIPDIGRTYWAGKQEKHVILKLVPHLRNEKTPATADHFFSILHGLRVPRTFWQKFLQKKSMTLGLEMVKISGKIHFFIRVPAEHVMFVTSQVYAHYPETEICTINEYYKLEKARVNWMEIETKATSIWPIKRFPQFEDSVNRTIHDPLSGVLQSLADAIPHNEMAGIQIAINPFDDGLFRQKAQGVLDFFASHNISGLKNKFEKLSLRFGFWECVRAWFVLKIIKCITARKSEDAEIKQSEGGSIKQSHERESATDSAKDKMSRLVFQSDIRIFHATAASQTNPFATQAIAASFKQFSLPYLNEFVIKSTSTDAEAIQSKWQSAQVDSDMILSTEELATLYHMPHESVKNPDIDAVVSRRIAAPHGLPLKGKNELTLIGQSNFRGQRSEFGIKPDDRRRHMYIAGKTGMGKSTLLENMIFSDIEAGRGVAVIDPHGDLADAVLDYVPKKRTNDVIWFDPSDSDFPISFNILECPNPAHRNLVASGVVGVFKKMFAESWGPRLEHILRNTLLALIEAEGQSLLGVLRILSDAEYRKSILKKVKDPVVLSFWNEEFATWPPRQVAEAVSPIQNKVGQFLSSSLVRNIVGQTKSSFDLRFAMDTKKIMIINLSKGNIGEDVSALLGAMLITKFQLDVMSRSDIRAEDRTDFYLYVDEFQNFATQSFATILSEARKYKLNLTVANQYLAQMDEEVRDAIFGNVGTLATFQVGFDDARVLSDQFGGEDVITPADIGSLPKYKTYLRLMMDGVPSPVFSADTLPPPEFVADQSQVQKIKNFSRQRYAKPRQKVEERIMKWSGR